MNYSRRGHKSCGPQKWLDADADGPLMLDLVEQNDLIEKDGAKHDELGAREAFDWHLTGPFKDVLEETIEWLDCFGA